MGVLVEHPGVQRHGVDAVFPRQTFRRAHQFASDAVSAMVGGHGKLTDVEPRHGVLEQVFFPPLNLTPEIADAFAVDSGQEDDMVVGLDFLPEKVLHFRNDRGVFEHVGVVTGVQFLNGVIQAGDVGGVVGSCFYDFHCRLSACQDSSPRQIE